MILVIPGNSIHFTVLEFFDVLERALESYSLAQILPLLFKHVVTLGKLLNCAKLVFFIRDSTYLL
jgi:hypothetical protein